MYWCSLTGINRIHRYFIYQITYIHSKNRRKFICLFRHDIFINHEEVNYYESDLVTDGDGDTNAVEFDGDGDINDDEFDGDGITNEVAVVVDDGNNVTGEENISSNNTYGEYISLNNRIIWIYLCILTTYVHICK